VQHLQPRERFDDIHTGELALAFPGKPFSSAVGEADDHMESMS
jgi:hypothetical protein